MNNLLILTGIILYCISIVCTDLSIRLLYSVKGKKSCQLEYVFKTFLLGVCPIINLIVLSNIWIKNPYNKEYLEDKQVYLKAKESLKFAKQYNISTNYELYCKIITEFEHKYYIN